ncbi:MAG: hypothetical protein KatS3mg011_0824 [Acidimicrobiia bacterium]|nr:MAG: hypothetical protein KatS3mg011_0824 [Acidimicrobiia bacterium]
MSDRPLPIRVLLVMLGSLLLLAGLAGLLLPILPGWLLIVAGLVILAGEFVWARRLLEAARRRLPTSGDDESRTA